MQIDPYANAPRLPIGEDLDPAALLASGPDTYELEIGPGRGWFIVERLAAAPGVGLIGLEVRRKWATIVDERLRRRGLGSRARVFAEDARATLSRWRSEVFGVVYFHFPDPWWKKRHEKRRVLTPEVVAEVARVLQPGGELFLQTDVRERAEACEALIGAHPGFEPWAAGASSAWVADNPYGAQSPRERRAQTDGLPIQRLRFRRR